ncbi:MAG: transketolase [Chitinophagaceae bacterium]|nr:transketolase [Chitinophagaceae bacterium]
MRTAFIDQLIKEATENESIFLLVGDLGYSVVEPFAEKFPDRFLNAGIAEQNMTGVAAGLAMEGYNVFTYSIGNFPTLRCMEQIRYDVCYHNLSVKIVAVGGGYAYGPLGVSHHTTEDIGMLRTIPNLTVCAPGDPVETRMVTSFLCNHSGPGYLRLGKAGEKIIHDGPLQETGNHFPKITEGKETVVLTTGGMLETATAYVRANNLPWGIYSVPFIKPMNEEALLRIGGAYAKVITLEEHQASAGFGSAILEGFNNLVTAGKLTRFPDVKRIAIPDMFVGYAGTQDYIRKQVGLHL